MPLLITFDSYSCVSFTGYVVQGMGICMVVKKDGIFRMRKEKSSRHLPVGSVEKNKISGQDCHTAGRDLIGYLWNRWVTCL